MGTPARRPWGRLAGRLESLRRARRNCLAGVAAVVAGLGAAANEVTVSPSVSGGDYTVSWPSITGAEEYSLHETKGGETTTYDRVTTTASYSFSGKAAGTYSYTVDFCQFGVCAATGYTAGAVRVNSKPTVAVIGDVRVGNGRTRRANVRVTDGDSRDRHTVSATSATTSVVTVSVSGRQLSLTAHERGTAKITYSATDNSGASNATSDARSFVATVPNSRPVVSALSVQSLAGGGSTELTVAVTDADANDTHTIAARSNDTGVATVAVAGEELTVSAVGRGSATVTYWATDNSEETTARSRSRTFRVTVANSRPTVTAVAAQSVAVSASAVIDLAVADGDADDNHTASASTSDETVATVSVSGTTLTLTGVAAGSATITYSVQDNSSAANADSEDGQFTVVVVESNRRPVVAQLAEMALSIGAPRTATVVVTDGDTGDMHTVSASSSDEEVATVAVSGKTLTVTGLTVGTATITYSASDDSDASNDESTAKEFLVRVSNGRPTVGVLADLSLGIGKEKTATVRVTDRDPEDTHTVAAASSRARVATVSVSGKTLTVTGRAVGTATITYSATDSSGAANRKSAERSFDVTVANSRPTVGAIADRSVAQDGTTQATVSVSDDDADDTHTIAATSSRTRTARVTVNGKTLTIRGIRAGRATISVTADDGTGAANATSAAVMFDVHVISGSLVVTVTPAVNAGAYTVSWPAVTAAEAYTVHEEHDGRTTSYDRTTTTNSKAFSGKAVGLYTYTVDFCQFGVCSPTGYGASSARVNSRPTVGTVSAQTVAAGDEVEVSVAVDDADDGDSPLLRAQTADAETATVSVSGTTLTVAGVNRGATTVRYWATDGTGAANQKSSERTFRVTVPNSRPSVRPIAAASVGVTGTATRTIMVADEDPRDTHTVAAATSDEEVATVAVSGKTLTVTGVAAGSATISVTARDNSRASNALSAERTFKVTVAATNARPAIGAIHDRRVGEGSAASVAVSVSDADAADTHTVSASSSRESVARVSVAGKVLTVTGVRAGTSTISVTATDSSDADNDTSETVEFDVMVISGTLVVSVDPAVNDGDYTVRWPAIAAAEGYVVYETHAGSTTPHDRTTTNSKSFSSKPVGVYSYTVHYCQFGGCWETGYGAGSGRVNSRPTVGAVTTQTVAADDEVEVPVAVADADDVDSPLLRAKTADAETATVSVSGTTLTVAGVNRGATTVRYWATDGTGAANQKSSERTFRVTVPNSRPSIAVVSAASVDEGATATRTVVVSDADPRDTHTVAAATSDEQVATVAVSGKTLTVTGVAAGRATISVTARDNSRASNALSAKRTFEVTVGGGNSRPVVAGLEDKTVAVGDRAQQTATVTDPDEGDTHTLSASSNNTAVATVSVNGKTVVVRGVSTGAATITVTATDSSGTANAASEPANFTVRAVTGPLRVAVAPDASAGDYTVSWPAIPGAEAYTLYEEHGGSTTEYARTTTTNSKAFTGKAAGLYTYTVHYCQFGLCADTQYAPGSVRVNSRPVVAAVASKVVDRGRTATVDVSVSDADADNPVSELAVSATSADPGVATVEVAGHRLTLAGVAYGRTTVAVTARDRSGAPNAVSEEVRFAVSVEGGVVSVSPQASDGSHTVSWPAYRGAVSYRLTEVRGDETETYGVAGTARAFAAKAAGRYAYTVESCSAGTCAATGYGAGTTRVNSRPVMDPITNRSVPAGGSVGVRVTASDADPDDPPESLTFAATSADTAVATVDVDGRTVTVRGVAAGSTTVAVTASDASMAPNQLSEPATFEVTVSGRAVAVTPSPSGGSHTVSWPASRGATSYRLHETHGASSVSYDVEDTSKSFADKAAGSYEYTVDRCAAGACTPTDYASATVRVNAQPVVAAISGQSVRVGASVDAVVVVTDADGADTHEVSAASSDRSVATVSVAGKTVTVTGAASGTATVTYSATDNSAAPNARSAEATFSVAVGTGNRRPVVAEIGAQRVLVGGMATVAVSVSDADQDDTHSVAAVSNNPSAATVSVEGETLTIVGVAPGTATITVTATDSSGADNAVSAPVRATVTVVQPSGAIAVVPAVSGGDYVVSWPEVAAAATYTLREQKGDAAEAYANISGTTRSFTGKGPGTYTYSVDSCTTGGTCTATGFDAASVRVNSPPVIAQVPPQSVAVGRQVAVPVVVNDTDDPAENLSVEGESTDASLATVAVAGTTITVTGVTAGTTAIRYRADDGSGATNAKSAWRTFEVTVTTSNEQPTVAALADQTLGVGASAALTVVVADADTDDEHTVGARSSDTGVVTASVSGATLTLQALAAGSATVTYWATDDSEASNAKSEERQFRVVVAAAQCAGTVAGRITGPTASTDGSFTLAWTGDHCLAMHDADGFWHFAYPSGPNSSKSFAGLPSGQYRYKLYSCTLPQTEGVATWRCTYSARAHTVNVTRDEERALARTHAAGTTAYVAGVGNDGSVRISVPIETIPGVHGLGLPIMLDYSSTRHSDIADIHVIDDHVGHGWRLAGIPKLHRCRVGIGGALALDATDRLCLDGIALVAVVGTYWAPGAEYRTEIQTHVKLVQRGTASEPWFEAFWPDGRTGTFGKTASRVRAGQRTAGTCNDTQGVGLWCFEETPYLKWGLDAMTHPFGNTLAVSYETYEPHGVLNPKAITYDNAEVRFRYGPRSDLAARAVTSASKVRRHSVLHTIDVGFRGRAVRQYRLDSNLSGGNLRLEKIQQCGYTEAGTLEGCLAPLAFSWTTVAGAPAGFAVGVSGITDGLGADTSFSYRTLGTIHSFGYAERPFGNLIAAVDTAGMSQVVATRLDRDDGRHGTRRFEYRYRGAAQRSTKGRGYLGFHATRVRDVAGGSYTYRQLRMDWPFLGAVARTRTLSGTSGSTGAEILSRFDSAYAALSMHGGAVRYPYTSRTTRWNYVEGGALGATKTVVAYTQSGEFLTRRRTTATTGSTVTVGPHTPTVWGDVPDRPIGGVVRTVTTTDDFANTASDWTIGKLTGRTTVYAAPGETTKTVDATFGYRAGSRVVSRETRLPSHPSLTLTTTRTFTAAGHVATEQVAGDGVAARTTSFGAYAEGRYPSSATNPLGHRTSFGYDVRHGAPKRIADPDARVATREYDAFGRVVRSTAADGTVATTTYARCTACPNLSAGEEAMSVTTTLRNGATQVAPTRRVYLDVLGREILTEVEAFDSADGWRRQFRNYDPQGRLRHVSRPFFSTATAAACWRSADCTVHHYGSADDQAESRIVRPDGGSLETVRSAVEGTATVDATVLVRREGTTAAERRTKRTTFNAAGEVVGTVDGHGTAKAVSTTYGYDAQGNLSRVAVAGVEVARMVYDELGNRTEISDRSLGRWTFEHNALSELVRRVDAERSETRYRHDALGRRTGRDECYWPCPRRTTSTWTYDPANATGALAGRSGGGLTETWTYRADGRPERVDTRIAVPRVLTESYARTFAYDAAGRPSSVDHAGTAFARDYNARGYLREVRHGATVLHEYRGTDAFGSSTAERLGGGALATTRGYDPGTGRLTGIATGRTAETGTPKGIQDLVYRWRTDGGLHRRTDGRGTAAMADDLTDTFTTDALGRVVRQATTGASTRRKDYAYDAFGNLSSKTSETAGDLDVALAPSTGRDGPYRLASAVLGGATARFIHSGGGNTVHYSLASGANTTVQYDAGNRVERISVGGAGGPRDEFWHGPDGERFLRRETWTESGARRTRLTVYLGAYEEARPSHGDFAKMRRVRATDVAVRVEKTARAGSEAMDSSSFAYLHRDHLGSVDRATDGAGNAFGVGATSFDPFGSRRRADRSADLDAAGREALLAAEDERSPRGFTDHEHLSRTGFVHMNGRVYDPRLGRFLSPDPIVANPFHSQSWNRYSYVQNRPMSFTDPTGHYMSGSYYGLTADSFNAVDWNRMLTLELWDYVGLSGGMAADSAFTLRVGGSDDPSGYVPAALHSGTPLLVGGPVRAPAEPDQPPVSFDQEQREAILGELANAFARVPSEWFDTADAAAVFAHLNYYPTGRRHAIEVGAYIFRNADDRWVLGRPMTSFRRDEVSQMGHRPGIYIYHSHIDGIGLVRHSDADFDRAARARIVSYLSQEGALMRFMGGAYYWAEKRDPTAHPLDYVYVFNPGTREWTRAKIIGR